MSTNSSLDRESFQQLLAAAFAVQESRMDTQSLSAIIEIQRLIAAGNLEVDAAIHLIANHARKVANAAGVAIGVIRGHQLVYRAGIGSAAPYAGRHITATLSVSADTKMGREILRVENAQTDPRIEAAICRQFGAESLLITPIYQGQAVTGVLEILFSEAHAFQDREVRAYRLMAGLVGEAMSRAAQVEAKASVIEVPVSVVNERTVAQLQELASDDHGVEPEDYVLEPNNDHSVYQFCEALAGKFPALWRLPKVGISQRMQRLPLHTPQWSAAIAALVAIALVGWSAYGGRRPASPATPALQRSSDFDQRLDSATVKPSPVNATSMAQSTTGVTYPTKAPGSAFRRVRIGENEVDYVADDVTIRHFLSYPESRRGRAYNQVEFGKDVTVRYFPLVPVASIERPVNHTLAAPEKAAPSKLAR